MESNYTTLYNNIHSSWLSFFKDNEEELDNILGSIYLDNVDHTKIYPPKNLIFKVFEMDVKDIKIVLLGQDPYHGSGQANGLSFSVNKGQKIPPSLDNIFKELNNEYPERNYSFRNGDLNRWFVDEKIFLLNTSLTVYEKKPNEYSNLWNDFTNNVTEYIDKNNKECLFLLLGSYAHKKSMYIKNNKYVKGIHPSPLSAHRGFFGSNIFKSVEKELNKEINWQN